MLNNSWQRIAVTGAIVFTVLAGFTAPAHAQGFVSPLLGFDFGGDSGCPEIGSCEDRHLNFGVGVGSMGALFASELELAYAKDFFGEIPGVESSVFTAMGNLMLAPSFGPVRPYGLVGLGLIKSNVSASTILESNNNHFGWDIGGGLMIFPSQNFGIRGDLRYFHSFQDFEVLGISIGETKLDFGRLAGGVVFRF